MCYDLGMGNGESSSKVGLGLAIGGVVVVALVVVLWLALEQDMAEPAATSSNEPQGSAVVARPGGAPTVTPGASGDHPALPQPAPGENPRDYVVGDIRVRDHRAGDHKPLDVPPNPHPIEGPKIPSTLTHEISQKLRAHVVECTASLPKPARGEKPRVEGQITIAIKDHKVTITNSTMQLRDVTGESVEPTKQCIESKALGIENSAPDIADLDKYSINVTYAIP
jgi:hypothetical protein